MLPSACLPGFCVTGKRGKACSVLQLHRFTLYQKSKLPYSDRRTINPLLPCRQKEVDCNSIHTRKSWHIAAPLKMRSTETLTRLKLPTSVLYLKSGVCPLIIENVSLILKLLLFQKRFAYWNRITPI